MVNLIMETDMCQINMRNTKTVEYCAAFFINKNHDVTITSNKSLSNIYFKKISNFIFWCVS